MSTVYRFAADEPLVQLRQWLWHEHISHYYRQQAAYQLIILVNEAQQTAADALVTQWRQGSLPPLASRRAEWMLQAPWQSIQRGVRRQPITAALIACSVLIYILTTFGQPIAAALYAQLMIVAPVSLAGAHDMLHTRIALAAVLHEHELWRLITPIFLHFNLAHLAFNMTWLWVFGTHVERDEGSIYWLGLVLLWGVLSNLAELFYGSPLFGGMSGVVYALMGYLWVEQRTGRRQRAVMPGWLLLISIIWALFGVIGSLDMGVDLMLVDRMANAAHFVGLLLGMATALLASLWQFVMPGTRPPRG